MKNSIIRGKRAVFLGDSIAYGAKDTVGGVAWGGRIEKIYGAKCDIIAVSGARITDYIPPADTKKRPLIHEQLDVIDDGSEYDYVILHGGVNDWLMDGPTPDNYGELSENDTDFDLFTLYGALQNLIVTARQKCPNAKIGFIINFNINAVKDYTMDNMVAVIKDVCAHYGVCVCNLYENAALYEEFDAARVGVHTLEGFHPLNVGYDILYRYIGDWMEAM